MRIVVAGLVLAVCGCAARQSPVPLMGGPEELAVLVGEWTGDYWSAETGRTGSISFTLTTRNDTASGNVIMIPAGMSEPLRAWQVEPPPAPAVRPHPEVLTISFVRVAGDQISGVLDPYQDPVCGCVLHTRFTGRLTGATIEGSYVSHHSESNEEVHGSWKVTRRGS